MTFSQRSSHQRRQVSYDIPGKVDREAVPRMGSAQGRSKSSVLGLALVQPLAQVSWLPLFFYWIIVVVKELKNNNSDNDPL